MLDQVVLMTAVPKTLNITAVDPGEILIVESISGLSAPKTTLFTGAYSGNGGYYQGRRSDQRNPVFNFRLNPDYANDIEVSDIREMLYRWFMNPTPGEDGLQVVLKDDRRPDRFFVGYTEDINTDMWVKEQKAQVSMLCVDPMLRSLTPFHWDAWPGEDSTELEYDGSAPTGLDIQVHVTTATPEVHLRLGVGLEDQVFTLVNPYGNFAEDSTIFINTIEGSRRVLYEGADVMMMVPTTSDWLTVHPDGIYDLECWGTLYGDSKAKLSFVEFQSLWWGI